MQVFILFCFDKEAVLYFIKNGVPTKCYYRGNDSIPLTWNGTQFQDLWEYFADVVDVENFSEAEILVFCNDKTENSLWSKLQYPISQNVSGINIQEYSVLLPHLAKSQNLLADGEIILAWRNYFWKVSETSSKALEEEQTAQKINDEDFAELIAKFLSAQKNTSQNLVAALEADKKQIEALNNEIMQTKAECEKKQQKLQAKYQEEKEILLAKNEEVKNEYEQALQKEKQKNLPYTEFLKSKDIALVHPRYQEEYKKSGQIISWMEACAEEFERVLKVYKNKTGTEEIPYNRFNFPACPIHGINNSIVQDFCTIVDSYRQNKKQVENLRKASEMIKRRFLWSMLYDERAPKSEAKIYAELASEFIKKKLQEMKDVAPQGEINLMLVLYAANTYKG